MIIERLRKRVERLADIADDPDVHRVVRVDLGRESMDVDDLLVGLGIDSDGIELLQLVTDGDDDVESSREQGAIRQRPAPRRRRGGRGGSAARSA